MTQPSKTPAPDKEFRDYVWGYFQVHAAQRLTTFNFYIALSTVVTTGLFATFHKDLDLPFLGFILGVLLIVFSLVFWRLDVRNRMLIKNSERSLKWLESRLAVEGEHTDELMVFSNEEIQTESRKSGKRAILNFRSYPHTYSWCFGMVFWVFGFIGVVGTAIAMYMMWV